MFQNIKIIDSHTHVENSGVIKHLVQAAQKHNFDKFAVMSISCAGVSNIAQNLLCALAKIMYPEKIYAYGGLSYPDDSTRVDGQYLLEQAVRLKQLGFDGMKMLEGKPDTRKQTGLPLDSTVYDKYYSYLEAEGIPVTYHVGDPKVFWDEEKAPDWAKKEGWTYTDGSFVSKEALYREVDGFLSKFPKLKVTFAHFFFMGEEGIKRASEFLDRWPGVNYDLTPGIEMYGSFSEDPENWREFFIKYQDRILFGSDNGIDESLVYIDVTRRFLETFDKFQCRDLQIKGIGLERDILEKIYHGNFEGRTGKKPAGINTKMLLDECHRVMDFVRHDKTSPTILPEVKKTCEEIREFLKETRY